MPQILVRDIETEVLERLKSRAKNHGRSLQGEAKWILLQAAGMSFKDARNVTAKWQKKFAGRKIPDTTQLLREDRER